MKLLAAALLALALPSTASAATCPPALPDSARCGTVTVPLDRSGAVAGTVDVFYARLPATGPRRGTLALLAGGPGDGASWVFTSRRHLRDFAPARRTHDLVIVDGRGTGQSGALRCHDAAECAAALGRARGHYATIDTADDLEAVRAALGVERWSLYGISYGTYDAQVYARRYPARVDRLVLSGLVSQRALDDPFALSLVRAAPAALRATCAGGACRGITRDPYADLVEVVRRVPRRPLAGTLVDAGGRRRAATLDIVAPALALLDSDVNAPLRAQLPAALAAARRGDADPLLRLGAVASLSVPFAPEKNSQGLFATAACEEQAVPWDRSTPPAQRLAEAGRRVSTLPEDSYAPFPRAAGVQVSRAPLCVAWQHAGERRVERAPLPDVPALLLNGDADLRTSVDEARAVAAELPRGELRVAHNLGHDLVRDDPTGCWSRAIGSFLRGARVARCGRAPLRLGVVPPRSAAGLSARRLAALTVRDALSVAAMRRDEQRGLVDAQAFGGLRGGRVVARGSVLRLFGVEFVPRVRVSGRVDLRGRGRVVVRRGGGRPRAVVLRGRNCDWVRRPGCRRAV